MAGTETGAGWREMKLDVGLIGAIGPLLARRDGDSWRYGLRMREIHANPIGVIHGGTLMAMLDQTATLIAIWLTGQKAVMTVQMDTRFLSAARVGELIEGSARLRHRTGSMLFLDAALSVDARPVADASVIMKIVPPPAETPDSKDR